MSFKDIVDLVFKSTTKELNNDERADAFLFLFHTLKTNNFSSKSIGVDEIDYIINKLGIKKKDKLLSNLQYQMIFLDIKEISNLILNIEVKKEDVLKPKVVYVNDEEDVLDQEGYMDAVKTGPTYRDEAYCKLLGITNE